MVFTNWMKRSELNYRHDKHILFKLMFVYSFKNLNFGFVKYISIIESSLLWNRFFLLLAPHNTFAYQWNQIQNRIFHARHCSNASIAFFVYVDSNATLSDRVSDTTDHHVTLMG